MRGIKHVNTSYWDWCRDEEYFRSRIPDLFFIGFQERLTEDFAILRSRLRMPDHAGLPKDDYHANRSPEHIDRTLSDEAVANLNEWYEADHRFIALCRSIIQEHPEIRQHVPPTHQGTEY